MLTPRGLTLLSLAVLAWALGRFLGVDELYVVSVAAGATVVLALLSIRFSSTRIAARRLTGTVHARLDEPVAVEVQLRNDGRLPASMLLVEDRRPSGIAETGDAAARFVVPGLRPRQVVDLRSRLTGRRRGRYAVGPLRIRLRDPFGLAERTRRYRATDDVVVFPLIERLTGADQHGLRQGAEASALRRAFHRGDEFYTMRAYVVGDDLRHVHWPSTAHRGTLMVRQHELPWNAHAVVHLDTRAHLHRGAGRAGTFERGVSAAASTLTHLRTQHYDTRLIVDASGPIDAVGDAALVRLAQVGPQRRASLAELMAAVSGAGSGLLVAIIRPPGDDVALADHPEVRALLTAGNRYRARLALVPAHDDGPRCARLARLLQVAGWHAAVCEPGEPLADPWHRAVIGAAAEPPAEAIT
jgi:uncharacterized protein (DUF58 family)